MILQALHRLAEAEALIGDPDFERKPVSWVVELTEHGELIQIAPHRINLNENQTDKKGKPLKPKWVGKSEEIPLQPGRTSGDLAFAFVDKAEYRPEQNGFKPLDCALALQKRRFGALATSFSLSA